jgi:acetylglutamate kinase
MNLPEPLPPAAVQAQVLHGVLPYLQSIHGKTFVVLCEGAVLNDPVLRAGLGRDVALLHLVGLRLVLVDCAPVDSLGILTVLHENLVGVVNQHGCRAVSITVDDGGPDGLAGGLVQRLHAKGLVPVVMPIVRNDTGGCDPVDADAVAGELARALGTEKLLFIADAPGALDRDGRLIRHLRGRDVQARGRAGMIAGRSLQRLRAAAAAVAGGVKSARLIDGRRLHALLLEVLDGSDEGTLVVPDASVSPARTAVAERDQKTRNRLTRRKVRAAS